MTGEIATGSGETAEAAWRRVARRKLLVRGHDNAVVERLIDALLKRGAGLRLDVAEILSPRRPRRAQP